MKQHQRFSVANSSIKEEAFLTYFYRESVTLPDSFLVQDLLSDAM